VPIKEELETNIKEWQELIEGARYLKNIIDANYSKHRALIKYLDNENIMREDLGL